MPRFVDRENYASSFGYEWNKYSKIRSDKYNKSNIIRNTILSRSGWDENHLKGKFILECGCGAGNDTEVLLDLGAKMISFDFSNSVESAFDNNKENRDLLIIQADIYKIPLKMRNFDIVYCHRVIQHTPNPEKAFYSMVKYLKKEGEMFLHSYDANFVSILHYKYLLRFITKRMDFNKIFKILKKIGPILYPIVGRLRKNETNLINRFLLRFIPFDNLDIEIDKNSARLTKKERFEYSLLNVFDALTPKYDNPSTVKTIMKWFKNAEFSKITLKRTNPIVVIGYKS